MKNNNKTFRAFLKILACFKNTSIFKNTSLFFFLKKTDLFKVNNRRTKQGVKYLQNYQQRQQNDITKNGLVSL